ncbi:hypothetical protein HDU77_005132 [Chytriomyces hyalinus]|nr:hypothetical protein HDU77_005132 [Chytriomyces hyalinus]
MSSRTRAPVLTPDAFFPGERDSSRRASRQNESSMHPPTSQNTATVPRGPAFKQIVATLDVVRITDRIVACGLPGSNPSDRKAHRNNVADLGLFLRGRYKDRFMVWNLTGDTTQGSYDTAPLNHQVVSFGISKAYQLSLKTLFDIARSMHAWLSLHPENVAVVHCTNGVGRTGIAIAAYLRYSETFSDAATAFEYFVSRRTPNDQAWPSVSQRRYIQYFNNAILVNGLLPTPYPLLLDSIVLNTIPDFDDNASFSGSNDATCRPGIEIYQNRKLIYSRVYTRYKPNGPVIVDLDTDTVVFEFSDLNLSGGSAQGLLLDRDVQIRIFHCADPDDGVSEASQVVTMVNFSFHTGFMPAGFIRVAARDLDLSRRDVEDGRFGAGFSMDLVFDEVQGAMRMKEEEKPVSYARCLDKSVSKCLARLISYHVVKVDERLMKGLEGMGISRLLACIALQKTNNDIKAAYDYFKSTLSIEQASRPSSGLSSTVATTPSQSLRDSATSPTHSMSSSVASNNSSNTGRRPPPTVADLRQQTQNRAASSGAASGAPLPPPNQPLHRDRSPSQNSSHRPLPSQLGRKASNASSDGGFSSDTNSNVRSSIQRLENLLQKSADFSMSSAQPSPALGPRSSSRSPKESRPAHSSTTTTSTSHRSEEDKAAEELLQQLRERKKMAAAGAANSSSTHPIPSDEKIELVGTTSSARTSGGAGAVATAAAAAIQPRSVSREGRRAESSTSRAVVPPPRTDASRDRHHHHQHSDTPSTKLAQTVPATDEYDYLDMYSELVEEELSPVSPTLQESVPATSILKRVPERTTTAAAAAAAPRHQASATPVSQAPPAPVLKKVPSRAGASPERQNVAIPRRDVSPAPPTAPPPPPPSVIEPEPAPLEKERSSTATSLTKLRESETSRKSTVLKKRQTLLWKDVEGEAAGTKEPANKKAAAVGRDGKQVEVKKFEELFCFVPGASKSGPKLVQKAQFTTLLDFRRANVIAIGMSRFTRQNITGTDLAASVTNLDTTKVNIDDLVQLKQLIPTESEARILNEYHNTPRRAGALPLAPAETFMIDLIKADLDIGQHVEAFLFLLQLPQEVRDMNSQLDSISAMCTQLQTSSDLKVVLRTVYQLSQLSNENLGAGNASFRPWMGKEAKAIGFKIDGLVRLKDVKSADGKWSLLNFLVDLVNRNRPDVLDFTLKFHALKQIRQIDLRQMIAQLFHLDKTLNLLKIYQYKNADFVTKLKPFVEAASTSIAGIRARFDVFSQAWLETARYFAEDPQDYILLPELFEQVRENPDPNYNLKSKNQQAELVSGDYRKQMMHLFIAMHVFLFAFEDCVKQNRRKVEEEAKKLAREAAAAEERRRREDARAIKEGRSVPNRAGDGESSGGYVPEFMQKAAAAAASSSAAQSGSGTSPTNGMTSPVESTASETSEQTLIGVNMKPNNAMRNRASVMLLQRKELEAQEMLERFSGMIQDATDLTDTELQQQAESMEDDDENGMLRDDSGSDAGRSAGDFDDDRGYDSGSNAGGNRDSFQSVVSSYPAGADGREQCQECFMPRDECYCNW